jgi:hypothetical protein
MEQLPIVKNVATENAIQERQFGYLRFIIMFAIFVLAHGGMARNLSNISTLKCNCEHAN